MGAVLPGTRRPRALVQLRMDAVHYRPAGLAGTAATYPLEGNGIEAACAALRALLSGHDRTPIDVHLACSWSRLLLLPWMDQLNNESRWQTYAQARFEQVFGDSTEPWEIHLARDLPGRDRIAVAWPLALRQSLAEQRNVRSARVGLLEHLGVLLAHEPRFCGCLIEIESHGAGFVLLLHGRPRRVRWSRFDDDEGLSAALRAEWASVMAAEPDDPGGPIALGVTPPVPEAGTARAATVGVLATGLGFSRAFSLPEWS